jgi:nucleoside-diphosphate-sugar epimerase
MAMVNATYNNDQPVCELPSPVKVLVTGAYGLIGNIVFAHLATQPSRYETYGMVRRLQPSARAAIMTYTELPVDKLRIAELTDAAALQQALTGIDVVVHLAGDPDGRQGWESVLNSNIIGAHNLFEAGRICGVKRLIYASTNQVIFGYMNRDTRQSVFQRESNQALPDDFPRINHTQSTRPLNEYACSKVFGEALAHMYSQVHGMSCICLRIGWVTSDDRVPYPRTRAIWCSQRDVIQLIECSINAPDTVRFDIFFGHSDNANNLVDISHAADVIGYRPLDHGEVRLAQVES